MLRHNRSMLLAMAVLFSALLSGGASQAWAHGDHDQNGYWDHSGYYHHYGYYHNHRGYWNQDNGPRIWINVG